MENIIKISADNTADSIADKGLKKGGISNYPKFSTYSGQSGLLPSYLLGYRYTIDIKGYNHSNYKRALSCYLLSALPYKVCKDAVRSVRSQVKIAVFFLASLVKMKGLAA